MSSPKKDESKGYKDHVAGSRKGKVHELFDREGADVAWTYGLRAKLAEGTLRSWFHSWRRDKTKVKSKPKSKSATKAKPAKVTAAPATQPAVS